MAKLQMYYRIEKFMHSFDFTLEELHVYAVIYSFSKSGKVFNSTPNFIQLITGVKIPQVIAILKKLKKEGFIKQVRLSASAKNRNKQYKALVHEAIKKEEVEEENDCDYCEYEEYCHYKEQKEANWQSMETCTNRLRKKREYYAS